MEQFASAWNRFWFVKGPPHALAIFRFFFGVFWLIRWCSWMPYVSLYFSGDGLHLTKFLPPVNGIHNFNGLMGWLTQPVSPAVAWVIYSIGLVLIVCICIGLFTRIALLAFFICLQYYYYLYLFMHGTSYDRLFMLLIAMLLLSPCGKALSIDVLLAKRKKNYTPTLQCNLWTQQMICVQVAIVYFATGIHKLVSPVWKNGDIIETAFRGDYAGPLGFAIARLRIPVGVYDLLTICIIIFELVVGFLLFSKRWQKIAFIAGAAFHIFNSSLIWIPEFLSLIFTYVLFVHPSVVKAYLDKQQWIR
jgi:hypothetical protein